MGGGIQIQPMNEIVGLSSLLDGCGVNQQRWPLRQRFCSGLDEHTAALRYQMGHQPPQTVAAMQDHLALEAVGKQLIQPVLQGQPGVERTVLGTQAFDFDLQDRFAGSSHGLVQHVGYGRDRFVPPAPRHVAGKDLVGRLDLTVLVQQRSQNAAAAAPLMPGGDPDHLQACGAEGWNMNIE